MHVGGVGRVETTDASRHDPDHGSARRHMPPTDDPCFPPAAFGEVTSPSKDVPIGTLSHHGCRNGRNDVSRLSRSECRRARRRGRAGRGVDRSAWRPGSCLPYTAAVTESNLSGAGVAPDRRGTASRRTAAACRPRRPRPAAPEASTSMFL